LDKVSIFIDGFNLYHAINKNHLKKYKWLNFYSLFNHFLRGTEIIENIYFFTALAYWNQGKVKRHSIYIKALMEYNVKIVKGAFRKKDKYCAICKNRTKTHEEKETDVNMAIYLLRGAFLNEYENAMILSADSDLVPVVKEIKNLFPDKEICIIIPPFRKAELLKKCANRTIKLKENHLKQHQLPLSINCKNGDVITKPIEWS